MDNNSRKGGQVKGLILVAGCAVVLATACTAGAFAFGCQNQGIGRIWRLILRPIIRCAAESMNLWTLMVTANAIILKFIILK